MNYQRREWYTKESLAGYFIMNAQEFQQKWNEQVGVVDEVIRAYESKSKS